MKKVKYNIALSLGYLDITEDFRLGLGASVTSDYKPFHDDSLSGYGESLSQALEYQAKGFAKLAKEIKQLAADFRYREKKVKR